MFDLDPLAAAERIGVIDLGSNSLRLVVFERLGAAVFPLFNEKVMCGLGRGISSTGWPLALTCLNASTCVPT